MSYGGRQNEFEIELARRYYEPSDAELAGIDSGLRDADAGLFASEEEVEAVFAKFRRRSVTL